MNYFRGRSPLFFLEACTLFFLAVIDIFLAGRPLLEGWGHMLNFCLLGTSEFFPVLTPRFFEQVPIGVAWLLGHGAIWGFAVVFTSIIIGKYLIARWALKPIINGIPAWILSTLAAILMPWNEQWYAHNLSSQLASLYMLITFGACIRLRQRFSFIWFALAFLSLVCSLLSYEALLLCSLAIPVVVFCTSESKVSAKFWHIPSFFYSMLPIALGILVYAVFCCSLHHIHHPGMEYYQQLLSGPQPIRYPWKLIAYLYYTAYFNAPWTYPTLIFFLALLVGPAIFQQNNYRAIAKNLFILGGALLLLPLFSLIFAVNFYFLSDLERVCLPVGFGFFLLATAAMAKCSSREHLNLPIAIILVMSMLIGTMVNAYTAYQPYRLQRYVLNQLEQIIHKHKANNVIVRDSTGMLGDRYVFQYSDTLKAALMVEGMSRSLTLSLCTVDGVDRQHPMMIKIAGHTAVPRCSELKPTPQSKTSTPLVIDVLPTGSPFRPYILVKSNTTSKQ